MDLLLPRARGSLMEALRRAVEGVPAGVPAGVPEADGEAEAEAEGGWSLPWDHTITSGVTVSAHILVSACGAWGWCSALRR